MTGKDRYKNIEIPAQLTDVIQHAQKKATARKSSFRIIRYTSVIAACIVFLFVVNIPSVTNAMAKIPVVGTIVQVLQFGIGGKITDGVSVNTEATENTLKIDFSRDEGASVTSVPSYKVEQKDAPNRLIFTLNGVRLVDFDKIEKDFLAQTLVKDVYRNIILDDSAIRFVVELKDGVEYSVTEFENPGYLEVTLTSNGESVEPQKVFSLRTDAMPLGEQMGHLEEAYPEEDISYLKTANGEFIAVIGAYDTAEEAQLKLKEISERESYTGDFYVDSWMSNESPN
ncbi:DUF4179 domain-containing protein [Paenibacillus sp. NPDC056933]|uniref:DUF4179 domain-containing protein n=1 Tax=Paenibacillus sp. NPDC056933 TaxID=3345968 RepID=UPI003627622C